ncbi:GSK3-beta interaction protein-like [Anneissia japonica]|uniref:GSK3-beta interaction protein-like n=1 Tax=Anneissia japonica TaxID=1529436 RepID=UPI001425A11A|nr:GSK3-beta interaction protein-like [Anneissia japonica]
MGSYVMETSASQHHTLGPDENCIKLMAVEAEAALQDIRFAVDSVAVSTKLPSRQDIVYMNIKTKEAEQLCVELSVSGYRIVGDHYDCISKTPLTQYYETIYALLDNRSPGYRLSFGEALVGKLQDLQQDRCSEPQSQTES